MYRNLLIGIVMTGLLSLSISLRADPQQEYQRGYDAYLNEDLITAMMSLESAAEQGHVQAQVLLAYILDKSEENEAAVKWYRKAAEAGDPAGEVGLAGMYLNGEGVETDVDMGRKLIMQAAEKGYEQAMITLADAYQNGGMGLEKDEKKSKEWREKAAQISGQ